MEKPQGNPTQGRILAIAGVLLIGGGLLYFFAVKDTRRASGELTVVDLPLVSTPQGFPEEIPIEPRAVTLKNLNVVAPDGRVQATRIFESRVSVADHFSFYKNFLLGGQNGWRLVNEVDRGDQRAVFGEKGDDTLSVNISNASEPGKTIVNVSFVAHAPVK